ncbi:MAG: hypothetical protein KAG14_01785, partial [Mycoplasmataceae bacterium]|nr:hypothetical protein [Mycoplasmataceae bacterium]
SGRRVSLPKTGQVIKIVANGKTLSYTWEATDTSSTEAQTFLAGEVPQIGQAAMLKYLAAKLAPNPDDHTAVINIFKALGGHDLDTTT